MKKPFQQNKQPSQGEIQPLLNLYNSGQLAQAEATAKVLLKTYPNTFFLHNVLGISLDGQGKFEEAVASYRKALSLQPAMPDLHFNLGIALSNLGKLDEAIASYRKAIALQPRFFEAYGNLGTVLQKQGKLEEAAASYRKAIAINPDALGHFNLATTLRNLGKLEEAIASFKNAVAANPGYADAYSSLGEALWHHGKFNDAVDSFNKALTIDPNNASANYNLALFLYDNGELGRAIPYFERSQSGDWRERVLYCLYKTEQYEAFKEKLKSSISSSIHISPFLATLSTHYAVNFDTADEYNFCKRPLDFVGHHTIEELAEPNSSLLAELLNDISHAEISQRKQSRLHHGVQSSGNLFKRPEASFQKLASLVAKTIERYRQQYAKEDCMFIKAFPKNIEFSSSWYVKMQSGGHLNSHIHEEGVDKWRGLFGYAKKQEK